MPLVLADGRRNLRLKLARLSDILIRPIICTGKGKDPVHTVECYWGGWDRGVVSNIKTDLQEVGCGACAGLSWLGVGKRGGHL